MSTFRVELYRGDGTEWDTFVSCQPCATAYHRYRWREVVEKSFGHKGYYLIAHRPDDEIAGILPVFHMKSALFGSFLVSVPFFNYGGVLGEEAAVRDLVAAAGRLLQTKGASHLELRHLDTALPGMLTKTHKVTMILDLAPDPDSQWQAFNAKLRNQVRKAEKSGLEVTVGGMELLEGFYTVFCRNMRDLGTPVYGRNFFSNVLASFPATTRIVSVTLRGVTVASGILSRFRNTMEIPWASSIREFNTLCPNNLLYWTALQHAIDTGCTRFDFGRSTRGEGTYRFKEQWGARPLQLNWQYLLQKGAPLPELNNKNPNFEKAIRIWQKLPLRITNMLGPHIVRNIP